LEERFNFAVDGAKRVAEPFAELGEDEDENDDEEDDPEDGAEEGVEICWEWLC
jgi:hypothetical protein